MLVHPEAAAVKRGSSTARIEDLRRALRERFDELGAEYAECVAEMTLVGVVDAGDDVADLGTKAFNRDQELALAVTIRGRMEQVERALERLDEGNYGMCEGCGYEIPVARLSAFPAATLCVGCKTEAERR